MYDKAKETEPILVGDSGMITFTRHFKYLGSYMLYKLKDDYDIEHRISQAPAVHGGSQQFLCWQQSRQIFKIPNFCAIPYNLLLWGCESWEIREGMLNKLKVFSQKCKKNTQDHNNNGNWQKITNEYVQKRFFKIQTIRYQLAKGQLTLIRKVVRN